MSAVLTDPLLTFEAYLAWEERQTERHKFFAGEVLARTGARATHNLPSDRFFEGYLVVEQNRRHFDLFLRNAEGLGVLDSAGKGESAIIAPLQLSLPMAAVYEGVDFGSPDTSVELPMQ